MSDNDSNIKNESRPVVIRNTTDLQRLKLEKLMKNPDKPIIIPERPKGRSMPSVPDFVRNVMGSSAGAGSGEFHVYRHLRRKEYARQKYIQEKSEKERLNDEYHQKLDDNRKAAEDKTAKKRAKRLKRKLRTKRNAKKPKLDKKLSSDSGEESDDEGSEPKDENDAKPDETKDIDETKVEQTTQASEMGGDKDVETKMEETNEKCDETQELSQDTVLIKPNTMAQDEIKDKEDE